MNSLDPMHQIAASATCCPDKDINSALAASTVGITQLQDLILAATSQNTRRAYRSDLDHFVAWGGCIPTTPLELAEYIASCASTLATATLGRRLVAIGKAHTTQELPNPASSDLVRHVMRGIRRTFGKPQRRVAAAIKQDVISMCAVMGDRAKDVRDRALLLIGFAGAFRRSELCAIDCNDLEWCSQGIVVLLRKSKTDQEGEGRRIAIPFARGTVCPVGALRQWLEVSEISEGPVFRSIDRNSRLGPRRLLGDAVAVIVKERAAAAGFDPANYSGHSLRAGLATSAAAAGVPNHKIRAQTGHRSDAMLARYIRDGQMFADNAAGAIL